MEEKGAKRKLPVYAFDMVDGLFTDRICDHSIEKHSHDFWEIAITQEGKYVNHFDSGDLCLEPMMMVIIRPSDVHYISSKEFVYRDIYISDEKIRRLSNTISPTLYDELKSAPQPPHLTLERAQAESCEQTATLITNFRLDYPLEQIEPFHNILILKALTAYYETKKTEIATPPPNWLEVMKLKLVINGGIPAAEESLATISTLIAESGYSHGYVCREFKKYFHCTPVQYWNQQKMLYSTSLLLNTDMSIAEIAQLLAYSNQGNYITTFKQHYGVSPSVWRKSRIKKMS